MDDEGGILQTLRKGCIDKGGRRTVLLGVGSHSISTGGSRTVSAPHPTLIQPISVYSFWDNKRQSLKNEDSLLRRRGCGPLARRLCSSRPLATVWWYQPLWSYYLRFWRYLVSQT